MEFGTKLQNKNYCAPSSLFFVYLVVVVVCYD